MIFYPTLYEASSARQVEWCADAPTGLSYFGNELGGEAGEVLELVFSPSTTTFITELADELGDVVICTINVAIAAGITVSRPAVFDGYSLALEAFLDLGSRVGKALNNIKKLDRERLGMVGSRTTPEEVRLNLSMVLGAAYHLANLHGIDLEAATRAKFNKTSSKYGLQTMVLH